MMIKNNIVSEFSLNYREANFLVVGFVICFIIFTIRNLDPLLFPTLYAEDGVWLGLIMQNGFLDTAFHARQGFPVFGLVGLDWVALQLNILFSNGNIIDLPVYVWFVSLTFLSIVSVFPIVAFRNILPLRYRLGLVLILPLMPVGADGNEIIGRIGNLVYLFPLVCIYSICLLRTSAGGFISFMICLALIFISAITFPVCLGILALWLSLEVLLAASNKYKIGLYNYFDGIDVFSRYRISMLGAVLILCFYLMPDNLFSFVGGAKLDTNPDGWVDYVGGRLVLYPMIASFYSALTNTYVILGCFFVFILMVFGALARNNGKMKFTVIFLSASFVLYFASTAIMRPGFTSLFGQYSNSFPDRYFFGINVLFLVTLCFSLYQFSNHRRIVVSTMFVIYFINIAYLHERVFEGGTPVMSWREFGDLRHMTCSIASKNIPANAAYRDNLVAIYRDNLVEFPIYPKVENLGWRMTVPESIFTHSIESACYGYAAINSML